MVYRMKFLRNMPNTFRMGAMGMGIEKYIVEISGSPLGNLPYKIPFTMRPDRWGWQIPRVYIGTAPSNRDGNIQRL